jgi:microcystin-dependent protein
MGLKSALANRRGFIRRFATAFAGASAASTGVGLAASGSGSPASDQLSTIAPSNDASAWSPRGGDPFLGEIAMVGFNFAPRGWALCDGQLLPIANNQALFSLLGTTYGGDGRTTFALPDLRGRVPAHAGTGPGLTNKRLGEKGGEESHLLTSAEMPAHNHAVEDLPVVTVRGTGNQVVGGSVGGDTEVVESGSTTTVGGSSAHNNMQPFLTLNFVIALQGLFPPRS